MATYLLLVATAVTQWRRRRTLALLAVTTLVLAAAGTYNGATIPESVEMFRINFYRWAFVVAFLAWIVIGWVGALGGPVPGGAVWSRGARRAAQARARTRRRRHAHPGARHRGDRRHRR